MKKKTLILIISLVAVGVIGAIAISRMKSPPGASKPATQAGAGNQPMRVSVQVLQSEKVGDRVVTVGNIFSNEEVELRSEVTGKIEKIYFREGARVNAGTLLLKINDAELQAQALRARSRLQLAQQDEERQQQLFEKNLASKQEYDNVLTNLNLVKADAQLVEAQIAKTEIRAPFSGQIGLRNVSEGSYLAPSTLITTLQDRRTVKIDFSIPEKYATAVRIGDKISFRVQGNDRAFTGAIYAIDPKIDAGTRTLRIRARSSNEHGLLLPGSLASVELSFQEKQALMIPSYALIPELKGHKVFTVINGQAHARNVQIGIRTDDRVEILQGVNVGDTLITSGILQLRSGMPVRPEIPSTKAQASVN